MGAAGGTVLPPRASSCRSARTRGFAHLVVISGSRLFPLRRASSREQPAKELLSSSCVRTSLSAGVLVLLEEPEPALWLCCFFVCFCAPLDGLAVRAFLQQKVVERGGRAKFGCSARARAWLSSGDAACALSTRGFTRSRLRFLASLFSLPPCFPPLRHDF